MSQIEEHSDADAQLARLYSALTAHAGRIYKPILAKLTESARLQTLLQLMDRFQFLLSLPARVRQHSSLAEKEAVLRDFEKARR